MPDTFTPLLRLELQQTGANNNTWGSIADTTFTSIEDAIAREAVIDLTGKTTYSLTTVDNSTDEARCAAYKFIGTLAGNCTVTMPSLQAHRWVNDTTTGGKSVILTCGGGTNFSLPKTGKTLIDADGTNTTTPAVTFGNMTVASLTALSQTINGTLTVNGAIAATSTISTPGTVSGTLVTATAAGQGFVQLNPGGGSNSGYVGFWSPAGVRQGYIGFAGGGVLNMTADIGGWQLNATNFAINAPCQVNSNFNVGGTANFGNGFIAGLQIAYQNGSPTFNYVGCFGNTQTNGTANAGNMTINGTQVVYNAGTWTINITGTAGFASSASFASNAGFATNATNATNASNANFANSANTANFATGANHANGADFATTAGFAPSDWNNISSIPSQVFSLNQFVNTNSSTQFDRVQCNGGGFVFYAPNGAGLSAGGWIGSDARWKENIRDITDDEARSWVDDSRSRHFRMMGEDMGGFIAQEDLESPLRKEAVTLQPTNDPRAAMADGKIPAGQRAFMNYNSHIAFLTHALKVNMRELKAATDRIAALEALVTHG